MKDKQKFFHLRWSQLKNSNISRDEYFKKETDLKSAQEIETHGLIINLIEKLSRTGASGFYVIQDVLNQFRKDYIENRIS